MTQPNTYLGRTSQQLSALAVACGVGTSEKRQLLDALSLSTSSWGNRLIPKQLDTSGSSWLSGLSNDHSPFEFSIAVQQQTGSIELRFSVEALPSENSIVSARDAALGLNKSIKASYSSACFQRFEQIQHLFMPDQPTAQLMAAWHSFVSSKDSPAWKIYLDPRIRGVEYAPTVIEETFRLLEMPSAWDVLRQAMSPGDYPIFAALDLSEDADARFKVYVAHPNATAAEVAAKHAAICPDASATEIVRFLRTLGGFAGPYHGAPIISTFAFTSAFPNRPEGTVNFRTDYYVPHDAEVQQRIERYLTESEAVPTVKDCYMKALAAMQGRPLALGAGIHSWVGLKMKRGGMLQNTFYFSPELYGPVRYAPVSEKNDFQVSML